MQPYNKPYVKSVSFYHHREDDIELHEKLKSLPHGFFQNETKKMWKERLDKEEVAKRERANIQRWQ